MMSTARVRTSQRTARFNRRARRTQLVPVDRSMPRLVCPLAPQRRPSGNPEMLEQPPGGERECNGRRHTIRGCGDGRGELSRAFPVARGRDAGPICLPHLDAGLETTSVGLSELGRETKSPESSALGGSGIPLNTASIYALWASVSTDMLVSCCCASRSLRYGRATRPKALSRPASRLRQQNSGCVGG